MKLSYCKDAAAIILCGVVVVCVISLTVAAERIMDGVQVAITAVNHPCAPGPCGLLAQMTKTVTKSGDTIVETQLQEQKITPHVIAAMDSLGAVAPHLSKTSDALSGSANALTDTAQAATQTIGTANTSLASVTSSANGLLTTTTTSVASIQPLMGRATLFVSHADDLVSNPSALTIENNLATMTTTANHMLLTGDQVETKLAKCTLHTTFACVFKTDVLLGAQVTGYLLR